MINAVVKCYGLMELKPTLSIRNWSLNAFEYLSSRRYQLPKVAGTTYSLLAMYLSFSGFQIFTHSCYCKCPPFSHSGRYVICYGIHSVFNLHFLMCRCWWRQQVGKGGRRKVHYSSKCKEDLKTGDMMDMGSAEDGKRWGNRGDKEECERFRIAH